MLDLSPNTIREQTSSSERRRWQRLAIAIPVFLRGKDKSGNHFIEFASALNISAGGMLIVARRYLPGLSGISLEIPSAPVPASGWLSRSTRTFRGKAVRSVVADRCHYVAFKFTRPLASAPRP